MDTVIPPDDGHIVARNMYRKEIKVLGEFYILLTLHFGTIHVNNQLDALF